MIGFLYTPAKSVGTAYWLGVLLMASAFRLAEGAESSNWRGAIDISGMVTLSSNQFLVVHDSKVGLHASRDRVSILEPTLDGLLHKAVEVDWHSPTNIPNDLEAICTIPGRASEFLLAESGYEQTNRFGRLFRIRLSQSGDRATLEQVWQWPAGTTGIEGIACVDTPSGTVLIAAKREGTLYQVPLKFGASFSSSERLRFSKEIPLTRKFESGWRPVTDLTMNGGTLWASAAFEGPEVGPARGYGPFRSILYPLAELDGGKQITLKTVSTAADVSIEGFKVEALSVVDGPVRSFVVGTDDEGLGGVWRLVPQKENLPQSK